MDIIQKIKNSIDPIVSLSDNELLTFCNVFESKRLKKNEFFLIEEQICNFVGFVNFGVLVCFKIIDNGDEITTDFAFEGNWVNNNQSRLSNAPSTINIRAIEEIEIMKWQTVFVRKRSLDNLFKVDLSKLIDSASQTAKTCFISQNAEFTKYFFVSPFEYLLLCNTKY